MATHERTPLIEPDSAAARRGASRPRSVSRLASVGALSALAVVAALTGTTRAVTRALASAGDDDVFAVGVFDDVPELRAEVRVEGLDRPLTLPWQPVSLPGGRSREPHYAFGAVSGHGLHCDMRAMAWLFADVPSDIPTAVFGARASSRADSKLSAGADAWLEGVAESAAASASSDALEDALVARVGFEAQAGDFAAVADAAGYETFVAVGESQSTAAALWAGVRQAEARRDAELQTPAARGSAGLGSASGSGSEPGRIRGLVLTLVPSMGAERSERYEELREMIANTFGDELANATSSRTSSRTNAPRRDGILTTHLEDCSVGYGCVPFAKYVAAKKSDLPSLATLAALAPWFPPTLVLADYADEPAHPVANGRAVAEALGARFGVVNTREEREARWPGEVATFIRGVYATETQNEQKEGDDARVGSRATKSFEAPRGGSRGTPNGVRDGRKQTRSLLDAYDDASERLVLNEDQLRASSRLCVGDVAATPTLESRCGSLTAEESEAWEADRAERSDSATGAPPPPARAFSPFYLRTGLGVDECEESDLGDVRGRVTE
jgi:pimeloyl-ACP methyl ester carboxylesterase